MPVRSARSGALQDFVSLRDVARELGASYFSAYAMSVSGQLGEPIAVGRTYLFPRATAEAAIRRRRSQRAQSASVR